MLLFISSFFQKNVKRSFYVPEDDACVSIFQTIGSYDARRERSIIYRNPLRLWRIIQVIINWVHAWHDYARGKAGGWRIGLKS